MNLDHCMKIRQRIFDLVGCRYDGKINIVSYDGVFVKHDEESTVVGCSSLSGLARGYFLFAKEIQCRKKFIIRQKAVFDNCGVFIDD